ncbi:invasion associated locus B family protein [Prosthecomicrobium sp. N25]|uniref:invasion associated locus B family protein n=1 Tax=Prosthecomicrobium sp. N25 TaxID=3129254 RepID=UPI003077D0E5
MADRSKREAGRMIARFGAVACMALGAAALPTLAVAQTPPAAAPTAPAAPKPAAPAAKPAAPAAKPAEAAKAPEVDGAKLQPGQPNPWVKLCSKDPEGRDICLIAQELRTEDGQVVGSVALREISGDPKKMLLIAVPPNYLVQPGLRIGVDKGKREEAKYTICFPNACYAEMPVSDPFIAGMKKGQVLVVTTLNLQEKPQNFPFGLAGFKESHEGPGIDPTKDPQSQAQLEQELQKRAEELRQKLSADKPKP